MRLTLEEALNKYGQSVFTAAFNICGSREDAADVLQDTMLRYFTRDNEFRDEEHLKAWLLRVAINRARDVRSSFWRRNKVSLEDHTAELTFDEPGTSELFEAVMALPERYRVPIHLFYYEDYSVREIARIMHSSEGSVKSRLSRGRKILKKELEEVWNDDE